MGDRGPAATVRALAQFLWRASKFSRWEIGGQPQLDAHSRNGREANEFSRWEIGGQPQQY